ncbi:MAG: histidine--tRNA ligase [Crocinitomicaceae bacterium]|tara:strand:+ start:37807 stop:39171 length:1365 start_codon:yes stop_codon:yes gene_type:complete
MSEKPRISKGTRDFLPSDVQKREYIFDAMKTIFKKYGYQAIETPSFELTSTLMGKYGDEGDRLIFRILNSGEKIKKADLSALENDELSKFANSISEKALRYDLTVPFARFVVQHQNDLPFPFKRYQIQPVWRSDRPQHGRYQEFTQCDIDVVGSDSLLYEVECIQIFDEVLSALKLPGFTIKINNRKILTGIAETSGAESHLLTIVTAIDKLDKIGEAGVLAELVQKSVPQTAIEMLKPLLSFSGSNEEKIALMTLFLKDSVIGIKGIDELKEVFEYVERAGLKGGILEFDITLARGLNYYTGAIFEVKADGVKMGSICGGGRYDDLTAQFGLKDVSGIGISFGADRIYDVLEELGLFPKSTERNISYLLLNFGGEDLFASMDLANAIRDKGIDCELYPNQAKIQKQFKYANDRSARFVIMIGEDERNSDTITLKNMKDGTQEKIKRSDFLDTL